MKRLIVFLLYFYSLFASAQTTVSGKWRYHWIGSDSVLFVATDTFSFAPNGSIAIKGADFCIKYGGVWHVVTGGAGVTPSLNDVTTVGNFTDNAIRLVDVATHALSYGSFYQTGGQGRLELSDGIGGFGRVTTFRMDSIMHRDSALRYPTRSGTFALTRDVIDSARAAISLTTGSSGAATYNNSTGVLNIPTGAAVFTSWPAETQYGVIFQSSRFVDTFDFDKHGSISLVRNGNYLDMTNGSVATPFPNYVTIGEPHLLSNWTFEDTVKLTGALSSSTYGQFKPGVHSINTTLNTPLDILLTLPTTDAGVNNIYLYKSSSLTPLATSSGTVTYSQNDIIAYKLSYRDSVITGTVKNITVGGADSAVVTYTYLSANGAPEFKPNTAQFAFYGIGATGTEQLRGMRIYSDEVKNANIMCLGPSRTTPYFEDYWAHGFPRLLNTAYPTVITHGGGADGIVEIARTSNDVKRSNDRIVILNDLLANTRRGGGNVAAGLITYDSIVNVLTEAGITVLHFNIPEDSTAGHNGIGMTDVDNYIRTKYASTYIKVWDSIGQGTNIMASIYQDPTSGSLGVHLNTLGQAKVAQALIASGKLTAGLNRVGQSNNSDYYITASKGKVELSPFTINLLTKMRANTTAAAGGVSMSSNTTNTYTVSTGSNIIGDGALSQDGSKVASTLPFEATGYIWSKGSASAYSLSNQTTGAQSWLIRSTGTQLLLCDAYNSYNATMRFDTGLNSAMYLPGSGQSVNIGTSSISAGYNLNVNGNAIITPAGGTVSVGPTASIPSSIFTVTSTSKGVLPIPNMTTTQRDAISSPVMSLLIFNTTKTTFQYYNGTGWVDLGNTASGRYTPTLTNGANVASSAAHSCHWSRSGDEYTVAGNITITPTVGSTVTVINFSLPPGTVGFSSIDDLSGPVSEFSLTSNGIVTADTTNGNAVLTYYSTGTATQTVHFSIMFTYSAP